MFASSSIVNTSGLLLIGLWWQGGKEKMEREKVKAKVKTRSKSTRSKQGQHKVVSPSHLDSLLQPA